MAKRGRYNLDLDFKEELKREIKQELLSELKSSESFSNNRESSVKYTSRKNLRALIWLVAIVLVFDILVFYFYYNPINFSNVNLSSAGAVIKNTINSNSNTNTNANTNSNGDCSDGTTNGECSKTKPYYCLNGRLVEAGYTCGCPSGYIRDFQSCKLSS